MIGSIGGSPTDFQAYVEGSARAEHDRIIEEAEALGVFGVPTMVFNGELFWGGAAAIPFGFWIRSISMSIRSRTSENQPRPRSLDDFFNTSFKMLLK